MIVSPFSEISDQETKSNLGEDTHFITNSPTDKESEILRWWSWIFLIRILCAFPYCFTLHTQKFLCLTLVTFH